MSKESAPALESVSVAGSNAPGDVFVKNLRVMDGIAFMVACMVGSGAYFAPGEAARSVGSPCGTILAFVLGGIISLFGALAYSELGTAFVSAGAESTYLRKAFGNTTGFSYTWSCLLIIGTGACTAIILAMTGYVFEGFGLNAADYPTGEKVVAVFLTILIGVLNVSIPQHLAKVNKFMMVMKVLGAVIVVIGAIVGPKAPDARAEAFLFNNDQGCFANTNWTNFINAVILALFSYSGWNMLSPLTEELANPARDVPRIYVSGMFVVVSITVIFNVAWFSVLPIGAMSGKLGAPFAETVAGPWLKYLLSFIVSICCFGSAHGMLMGSCRLIYSVSSQGQFPAIFARTHPKNQAPYAAIGLFTFWTCLAVVFLPDLKIAVAFFTIGQWSFFMLAVISCLRLRQLLPDVVRPYKVNLALAVLFILACVGILVDQLRSEIIYSSVGFAVVLSGWLAAYYFESLKKVVDDSGIELSDAQKTTGQGDSEPRKKIVDDDLENTTQAQGA